MAEESSRGRRMIGLPDLSAARIEISSWASRGGDAGVSPIEFSCWSSRPFVTGFRAFFGALAFFGVLAFLRALAFLGGPAFLAEVASASFNGTGSRTRRTAGG